MYTALANYLTDLKQLRASVRKERSAQVAKKGVRDKAHSLGDRWFKEFLPELKRLGIPDDVLNRYSGGCTRLIRLSAPNNLKTSYLSTLKGVIARFRDELVLPVQTAPRGERADDLRDVLGDLPDKDESAYLQEAAACAGAGHYRAAVVLGWCSGIDRIHRVIDRIGFEHFNVTSSRMASQQVGRFRRFNKVQQVQSISELREVFDKDILWILEGMGLIDINQHRRLLGCFELRCQCAHPGDAPVTVYNLLSFYSDIKEIVLTNPKFAVLSTVAP